MTSSTATVSPGSTRDDGPTGLTETARRLAGPTKWVSLIAIALSLLVLGTVLPLQQLIEALRGWIDDLGIWGPVAYGAIYVVATVLLLPGLILTIAAGAIFGLVTGTIVVSLASTTGVALAFLIARYLARRRVEAFAADRPRFAAVDRAIAEGGWKVVAMLRLSPVVPFNLQNYMYGLTSIRFWTCVLTSWVAMLPGTFMYVYIGHVTGIVASGERERTVAEWIALGVGLAATVAVTIYVTKLATAKLKEQESFDDGSGQPDRDRSGREPEPGGGWPWGATVLAVVAIAFVTLAACARLNPEAAKSVVSGALGGPPPVEMTEAHERREGGPSVDHSAFDALLKQHVDDDGWVDYEALRRSPAALDGYLETVAAAPFDELGRDEKLALLINAYNAYTLKLILDNWPVGSIRSDIDDPWKGPTWNVGGRRWTLDQIEHEQIRPNFAEPRIHFAVVCAAVGCPPLRNEAYAADRLEAQLADQTRYVHAHGTWARFDEAAGTLHLTKLYDWYGGDFEQAAGSVLAYVGRHMPAVQRAVDAGRKPRVRWLDYDWSLNSRANRTPR